MCGVSGQEQPAELHGLDHKAAHACHAFLQNWTFGELPPIRGQANLKFLPDFFVAPQIDVLVRFALQIQPADLAASAC